MSKELLERRSSLAKRYIESEEPNEIVLEELNKLSIPIYRKAMSGYYKYVPYLDKEDFLMIGYTTLWKVLENCRNNPKIIDHFSSYLSAAVKNQYIKIFQNYVFNHPVVVKDYESRDGDLFFLSTKWLSEYKERVKEHRRQISKEYRKNHLEQAHERERRYREKHKKERSEYSKWYKHAHKEEIKEKNRKYAQEHREEINARNRKYWHEHLEQCRAYHLEYNRKERHERPELSRERSRRYREKHREEINARKREAYRRKKELSQKEK